MEPVEFRDMEYVMAVHEEQSFSGAARKHFISQPVLSRVVRKVERNLGVTLHPFKAHAPGAEGAGIF